MSCNKPILIAVLLAGGACLADPRYASLKITTQPDSAVVVLDGLLQARAPLESQQIEPGKHQLVVFKNGYKTYDRMVAFECGKKLVGHVKLDPLPGPADSLGGDDIPEMDDTLDVLRMPIVKHQPRPNFPESYLETSKGGFAVFSLLVDELGSVLIVVMPGSDDLVLYRDAIAAVRRWKFEPALRKDGKPRKMWVSYSYELIVH